MPKRKKVKNDGDTCHKNIESSWKETVATIKYMSALTQIMRAIRFKLLNEIENHGATDKNK